MLIVGLFSIRVNIVDRKVRRGEEGEKVEEGLKGEVTGRGVLMPVIKGLLKY